MASARSSSSNRGFTLVEVIISMAILTLVALSVAQLFGVATKANFVARGQTSATALAEQRMEQLRALTWGFDTEGQGLPVSDTSTNLSVMPPAANGPGLNPSPADSLESNQTNYFDYLDAAGAWVGNGATPPTTAVYVRRWCVQPLPTNPNNTLILQVLVTPLANEQRRAAVVSPYTRSRMPGEALLISVKTRKAS